MYNSTVQRVAILFGHVEGIFRFPGLEDILVEVLSELCFSPNLTLRSRLACLISVTSTPSFAGQGQVNHKYRTYTPR